MNRIKYYLSMAQAAAKRSKDPSTQTGAIIVDPIGRIVSTGYNGFPSSMLDSPEHYANRDEKLSRVIHAEMNAILFAQRDLADCSMYLWPWMPCERCLVHVAQVGIRNVMAPVAPPDKAERWAASFEKTRHYAHECGVIIHEVTNPEELP